MPPKDHNCYYYSTQPQDQEEDPPPSQQADHPSREEEPNDYNSPDTPPNQSQASTPSPHYPNIPSFPIAIAVVTNIPSHFDYLPHRMRSPPHSFLIISRHHILPLNISQSLMHSMMTMPKHDAMPSIHYNPSNRHGHPYPKFHEGLYPHHTMPRYEWRTCPDYLKRCNNRMVRGGHLIFGGRDVHCFGKGQRGNDGMVWRVGGRGFRRVRLVWRWPS